MKQDRIAIAGGGIIGLSIALELKRRGLDTVIFDEPRAGMASTAAAGMLAAEDPENPSELHALSRRSIELYTGYLKHIEDLSGQHIVFETSTTLQKDIHAPIADRVSAHRFTRTMPALARLEDFVLLREHSVDPRRLFAALKQAVEKAGIQVVPLSLVATDENATGITLSLSDGSRIQSDKFIDCTGAWMRSLPNAIVPRKGQMLRVQIEGAPLYSARFGNIVIRTQEIYIVPRLDGSAVIGATVEDAGFDITPDTSSVNNLLRKASELVPVLAKIQIVETWAGLRPATRDGFPLIGAVTNKHLVAGGHFRNGILLAPATAEAIADLLQDHAPRVPLTAFQPLRDSTQDLHAVFAQPS